MTTLMLALPLSNPIRGPVKKRRVLLVDTSPSKRELRAETMRRLGMDVDCAADISEARSWWRADLRPHAMLKHGTPSPPQPNLRFCLNCRKRKCNEESLCW